MKKLLNLLALCMAMLLLTCCGGELDSLADGHHRSKREKTEHMMKTVRMSFGGDFFTESEEPLLRADDGDTYVGINVFRTEKDNPDAKEEKYAYGLFKEMEGLSVDLLTGYTYRFEASVLIEREDKLIVNNRRIGQPFRLKDADSSDNAYFETSDIGVFHYTDNIASDGKRISFIELSSGTANVDAGEDYAPQYGDLWYPRIKRFYGIASSFDPALSEEVEIDMKYACFGLRLELTDLPAGSVTVSDVTRLDANRDKEDKQRLVFPHGLVLSKENVIEWEGLYSMHDLKGESETFTLRFTWNKGGSARESFEASVTVRPKTRKILRLNITGTPNYVTKGNLTLSMDTEDLTDDIEEIGKDFN